MTEPDKAFPYKPPNYEIKERYAHIFESTFCFKEKKVKFLFDRSVGIKPSAPIYVNGVEKNSKTTDCVQTSFSAAYIGQNTKATNRLFFNGKYLFIRKKID